MTHIIVTAQKDRIRISLAALVLLAVSIVVTPPAWAGFTSEQPVGESDAPSAISPSAAYAALLHTFRTGEELLQSPGSQDARSYTASANLVQTDAAYLAANPQLAYRRPFSTQRGLGAATRSARLVALGAYYRQQATTFLDANPEIGVYQRYAGQPTCPTLSC